MKPWSIPFALLAFLAIVAVVPAWIYFVTSHPNVTDLSTESQFLAGLILPVTVLLFLAGWLQPGGT